MGKDIKGKFQLMYIEDGKVYPAYPTIEEDTIDNIVDTLAKMGMFGNNIGIDRKNQIGVVKSKEGDN